jgi:glycosyltransferase involved in cell wall biosynthesis
MRVLFSLLDAGVGGGQSVALHIARGIVAEGDEVGLVVPDVGPTSERFRGLGARIHLFDFQRIRRPIDIPGVARTLGSYDVLYSHTAIGGQVLGDIAARIARRPHLVHQHTFPQFSSKQGTGMLQRASFRALLARRPFIAVAPHIATELVRLGADAGRVRMIPNGVSIPEDPEETANQTPLVGLLGRFDPGKGMLSFIEAAQIAGGGRFIIGASPGPFVEYESEVRTRASEGDVEVAVPGENGQAFLRSLDMVVIPSRYEGCPLVLLEAMALGKPIVAADIPGIRAVVGSEGALLVPPDDPVALANAIQLLMPDAALRRLLADEARRIVADRFTLEQNVSAVAAVLRDVAGRS